MGVSEDRDQAADEGSSGAFSRIVGASLLAAPRLVVLAPGLARLQLTLLVREGLRPVRSFLVPSSRGWRADSSCSSAARRWRSEAR
jgi:hypothetical protein